MRRKRSADSQRDIDDSLSEWRSHLMEELDTVDERRKERNWRQIQLRVSAVESLAQKRERRNRIIHVPGIRTGVAVCIGLAVVAYGMLHIFMGRNERATAANLHATNRQTQFGGNVTKLPLPNINAGNALTGDMFSQVSANGNWMITDISIGGSRLRRVNGTSTIHLPAGPMAIYGETPGGRLLLGVTAGGGGITELLNPNTGVTQKLPGQFAPAAHWVYDAKESDTGHWAMTVANSNGAGPTQRVWMDIDGQKAPVLQNVLQYSWSPDGHTLAAVETPANLRGLKAPTAQVEQRLLLYNASTGKVLRPRNAVHTTKYQNVQQFTGWDKGPVWSTGHRYVLYPAWLNLFIYDTKTGRDLKIPIQPSQFFGFLPNGEIYVAGDATGEVTTIHQYLIQSDKLQPSGVWHSIQPINGVVVAGQRLLVGVAGPSAGKARGSGQVVALNGTHASAIVPSGADIWWYDSVNKRLYFGDKAIPGEAAASARSVAVRPTSINSGAMPSGTSNAGGQPQ